MAEIAAEKVKQVQIRLEELNRNLKSLSDDSSPNSEFFRIIHRPGWTTLPEVALASGIIESMLEQAKALKAISQVFVTQSREIGKAAT